MTRLIAANFNDNLGGKMHDFRGFIYGDKGRIMHVKKICYHFSNELNYLGIRVQVSFGSSQLKFSCLHQKSSLESALRFFFQFQHNLKVNANELFYPKYGKIKEN